jgi:hypothetical protein|tara:strand:- start:123 stop:1157 length:1035 start_codon:yes stop_codon:yes gene_type:complete
MTKNIRKKSNVSYLGSHIVEGVEYPNLPSIAEEYGMKLNAVYKRYSRGYRGDDLVPLKKRKNYIAPKKIEKYKLTVNGIGYKSVADACRKNNVNYSTFRKRYETYGWSLERSLGVPSGLTLRGHHIHTKTSIVVKGKTFESITEAAKHYGKDPEVVMSQRRKGQTIEQALGLEIFPTEDSFKYEGKLYKNLRDFADRNKFPYKILLSRIVHQKKSLQDAIKLGTKHVANEGRYNEVVIGRDDKLASKNAYLYFASVIIDGKQIYKIGITVRNVKSRLSQEGYKYKVIKTVNQPLQKCYLLEKKFKNKFSKYRDYSISANQIDGFSEIYDFPENMIQKIIDSIES